ncbi:uncharacterized protein N7458_000001 [Penicillium daleae]|uniref:Nephrocystin 3-like N-terminal domain-containing protein n=1 Tax=Penicillium daleae TaxID=63821 RepID=A0AAD6CF84_9EURO|nr:uncharacterized protein N7458_000001 [Penicillium daleae]KAJ5464315.1 hypothetical protein N7458_000001 [Penicillium daleae]
MDGLSSAASVIEVIRLAGSIVKICGGYIKEVKDARDEIRELQETVADLAEVLQELKVFLQGPNGAKLSSSRTLDRSITKCFSTLRVLEPLKGTEVEGFMSDLATYKSNFTLSLQIDQTSVVTGISETTDRIDRNMDLEQLPVARGAEFDSYTNQYEDYCLPGTREEILRQVLEWARSPRGKCIFWLNSRAGTGKSTISRTVTEILQNANLLGANFFFKRGERDRGSATKLFPTIIRQLAKNIPQLTPSVQKAIHDNSDIATKGLKQQFDKILLQPLLGLNLSTLPIPIVVIVIDALDECDVDNDMRLVLQLLPRLQETQAVRLRVFLTSRPEWPILQEFSKITRREYEDLILHQIPEPVILHDISLFFKHRLSVIRTDRSLPIGWPGDTNIQNLVSLSVPLFIFAATICRMFEDPHWDPVDSLQEILMPRNNGSKLDGTYLPVLNRLLNGQNERQEKQLVQEFQQVIGAIVILESPLSVISLSRLIGLPERIVYLRLNPLHSVLSVPDDETLPVRLYHLSFRGFLLDPETRGKTPLWVDKKDMHCKLATRCLLRHFLHWVEAMNLLGVGSEVVGIINLLQTGVAGDNHDSMSEFLFDAERFILKNCQIADTAPLQLYHSGLIFTPEMSIIRREFETETPGRTLEGHSDFVWSVVFSPNGRLLASGSRDKTVRIWDTATGGLQQTLEGHSDQIQSVVFSPDGRLLASGSRDKTVRIWDTTTGSLQQTLEGYSDQVHSVGFSPDGRLLASGSADKTVRLWSTATGGLQQTLEGYSDQI